MRTNALPNITASAANHAPELQTSAFVPSVHGGPEGAAKVSQSAEPRPNRGVKRKEDVVESDKDQIVDPGRKMRWVGRKGVAKGGS